MQTVTKYSYIHILHISSTSCVAISSKVAACISQPVAFNGHMSTRVHLIGLRHKPQQKQTHQHLAEVY